MYGFVTPKLTKCDRCGKTWDVKKPPISTWTKLNISRSTKSYLRVTRKRSFMKLCDTCTVGFDSFLNNK